MPEQQTELTTQELELLQNLGLDLTNKNLQIQIQELLQLDQKLNNTDDLNLTSTELFADYAPNFTPTLQLEFSPEAKAVFEAGQELWKYYHSKPDCDVNASFYDIKTYFQGTNEAGRMNNKSADLQYTVLIANLRENLKNLELKIQPKVYDFGFLHE